MKNRICGLVIAALLLIPLSLTADEGMWLVQLLEENLMRQMKAKGLALDAKEIYNEEGQSIAGAIVSLDFSCTGSMISDKGLMITNHHCAYDDIHKLSTPEKNYLEQGFFAITQKDEIPIPGKSVYFLRKVLDVTDEVRACKDSVVEARGGETAVTMRAVFSVIEKRYSAKDTTCTVSCAYMWRGLKYYLYFYEVYNDVRLVAAPPMSLAAFGGEADNWQWPQHKIDFTIYRVYSGKDGQPTEYAADNVPLKPRVTIPISTKGVDDGDFAMILGFPGRTGRYQTSYSVAQKRDITNPVSVSIRRARLDIMRKWMDADTLTRLNYADKFFGISNHEGYLAGETKCFRRFNVEGIKKAQEVQFRAWVAKDPVQRQQYGLALDNIEKSYQIQADIEKYLTYFRETLVTGSELITFANRLRPFKTALERSTIDSTLNAETTVYKNFIDYADKFYEKCDLRIEKEVLPVILRQFTANVPQKYWSPYLLQLHADHNGDAQSMADYLLSASFLPSKEKCMAYMNSRPSVSELLQDPIFLVASGISVLVFTNENKAELEALDMVRSPALFTQGMYAMNIENGIPQYPDANATMRLTYGTVGGIAPSDAVQMKSKTTDKGYWEKYDPTDFEFHVQPKTMEMLAKKDFGRWANEDGELNICFMSNNDITGGNSGSPVLNATGEIIGLAFDGNLESLAGDAYFDPEYNKCVNVDIRAVLWVLDKYAGLQYLLDEIGIFSK
ncbi:MAG: S46 family peptidase [Bacteroidales bacterium]|nr:S46 family peptidase [Bacteroidales bacterium]MCL2133264.1 S46 family peptidase [Bacteroidales bacterium]